MNNNSVSGKTYNLLKSGMNAATLRHKVISNNISNINTKGYKKFQVVFEENIKEGVNSNLKVSNEKHLQHNNNSGDIKVIRDESSSVRKDGNNVDIDNEMANLAANTLMYDALISEMKSRMTMRTMVIKGGK